MILDRRAATRLPARALLQICRGESLVQIAKHAASGFLQLRAAERDINASARARSPLRSATNPSKESARELRGSNSSARRAKSSTELSSPLVLASCLCASSSSAIGSQGANSRAPSGSETAKLCPAVSATINAATRTSVTSARMRNGRCQPVSRGRRSRAALSTPPHFGMPPIVPRLDLAMRVRQACDCGICILTCGANPIEWHTPQ